MPLIPTAPVLPGSFETAILEIARRMTIAYHLDNDVPEERSLEGAREAMEAVYGYLRGQIPYPLPVDLLGVAVAAGLRITKGFSATGAIFLQDGRFNGTADFRPWSGFLMVERVTLNRYRQRTA